MGAEKPSRGRSESRVARSIIVAAALALAGAVHPAAAASGDGAPSAEELRRLIERMIANTHRNDAAIEDYERVEHWTERKNEKDPQVRLDKTYRVVPTGTGTLKVILKENGNAVAPEFYHNELRQLETVLEWALDPNEPKQKERVAKWKKRTEERFQAVEAFRDAYSVTWLGRETRQGRTVNKLRFEPKPEYRAHSVGTDLLSNSRVTVWLDGDAQVTRVETELIHDMAFGGGLLGKIYRGGRVSIDQVEVAPGLWMPRSTSYEVKGRKFLFPAEQWRAGEASDYRRVGPPREALEQVRRELSKLEHGS
jgi:hypothetical protein